MIAMMNSWRSNYWSNPLIEDATLDSCAQWTAEEMNRIGATNHLKYLGYQDAGARCPGHGFVTENWAYDYNMTIDKLESYWSDSEHMLPATWEQYHYVGVGISGIYYVLQAATLSGSGDSGSSGSSVSGLSASNATDQPTPTQDMSNYINPVVTSTPSGDGNIYHVVQYGQYLYQIATQYGVTIAQIKQLNGLTSDNLTEGQVLKIRLAPTVTITPTRTATVPFPTRTPTQTPMPVTPSPTPSITPTPTPTGGSGFPAIDRQWLGLGLLIASAVGFFIVFYFFFLKSLRKK